MKLNIYILFVLSSLVTFSQEYNKKTITTTSKSVLIQLASVENIELVMNENIDELAIFYKNTDIESIPIINDDGFSISIVVSKNALDLKGTEKNKYRAGQPLYPSYIVSIPKGMEVQLLYEKGNFQAINFNGNLDLRLNSGFVTVNEFKGVINMTSFSGKIDCTVNSAQLNISSNKGEIVSDLKDVRLVKTLNSLKGTFKNTNNVLKIKTIQAKVNLKSMSTQK